MTENERLDATLKICRGTVSIFDAMFARGAIKGEEALTVGQLRDLAVRLQAEVEEVQADLAASQ